MGFVEKSSFYHLKAHYFIKIITAASHTKNKLIGVFSYRGTWKTIKVGSRQGSCTAYFDNFRILLQIVLKAFIMRSKVGATFHHKNMLFVIPQIFRLNKS